MALKIVHGWKSLPDSERGAAVALGNFDGVHLGHRAVIDQVRLRADALGARSVVVTFDRHPATIVRPESAPKLLTSNEQKMELLEATGIDAVVVVPFDERQAAEPPESFVERVLVGCLRTKVIVVGEDFHFGRHRDGNVDLLRKMGDELDFEVEPIALVARADGVDEPVLVPGNPVKLSKVAEGPETRVPWLGEHTDEVLTAELGLDADRLEALRAAGVIG